MRGRKDGQNSMLALVTLNELVPARHPIRTVKKQLQALDAAGQGAPGWVARSFGRLAVLLAGALVVMVTWAVADDLWRRWDSYLEVLLGLGLGLVVLAAGAWLVEALRGRRRGS